MNSPSNPRFGETIAGVEYIFRAGVYAVIVDHANRVAAIRGEGGYFLPGGGIEPNENEEEALAREVMEECGASVTLLSAIGQATDFLHSKAEESYFEKHGTFYLARLLTAPSAKLVWITSQEAPRLFRQGGHAWAITQAIRKSRAEPSVPENAG